MTREETVTAFRLVLLGGWLIALLAGCGLGRTPAGETALPAATGPAAVVVETPLAPTPAAAATMTPTPLPTVTPGPSPTPEPSALLAAVAAPVLVAALPSADGALRAEVLAFPCTVVGDDPNPIALEILRIVDPAAGVEYQLDSQQLACGGLGAFGLEPLAWSRDGRYLWYTTAREGGPDGACRPWARPVTRIDRVDWSTMTLESAAVGPYGQRIAGWLNGELIISALDGSELGRLAPAALPPYVGPPVWSPDGAALVYLQYTSQCGETPGESAVVLVNPSAGSQRVLLTQSTPEIGSVSWIDIRQLRLTALQGGEWVYDLTTGLLVPAP